MSQIAISGNAAGTGVLTIASPNTNSNYTLTLPAATTTFFGTADNASASDITGVNTTATVTSGTTAMTVGSATNIVAGMVVVAQGITPGTTVSSIVGTAVTLSANAGATLSAAPVTFYSVTKVVTPGSIGGQTCRAWVNFNGTTGAVKAAFNVSSITVNSTGNYTVTMTGALTDSNYCVTVSNAQNATANTSANIAAPSSTTAITIAHFEAGSASYPATNSSMCVAVFR
jgi:hypothetical protein